MYTVKQFGKTSCSALLRPDLALRAGETPDQIIDLTNAFTNHTSEEVGREDKGEEKAVTVCLIFFFLNLASFFVKTWDEAIGTC